MSMEARHINAFLDAARSVFGTMLKLHLAFEKPELTRVIQAIQAGVNNYAVKPFTPEGLAKIIETTMAKAGAKAA